MTARCDTFIPRTDQDERVDRHIGEPMAVIRAVAALDRTRVCSVKLLGNTLEVLVATDISRCADISRCMEEAIQ